MSSSCWHKFLRAGIRQTGKIVTDCISLPAYLICMYTCKHMNHNGRHNEPKYFFNQFWKKSWVDFGRVLDLKLRAKIDHVASCWPSARNSNNAEKTVDNNRFCSTTKIRARRGDSYLVSIDLAWYSRISRRIFQR